MRNFKFNSFCFIKRLSKRMLRIAFLLCVGLSALVILCIFFPTTSNAAEDGPKVTDKVEDFHFFPNSFFCLFRALAVLNRVHVG